MYFVQDLLYIVLCAHCSVPQGYCQFLKAQCSVSCSVSIAKVHPMSLFTFSRPQCSKSAMITVFSSNMLRVNMWHLVFFFWGGVQCMWYFQFWLFCTKMQRRPRWTFLQPFVLLPSQSFRSHLCAYHGGNTDGEKKGYVVCEGNIHGTVGK